jgi:hypothetical protein
MSMQPDPAKATPLTPAAKAALDKLADIAVLSPPAWTPQTWGWALVAVLLLALAIWLVVRAVKRRHANRYRVEALQDLSLLESQLQDDETRAGTLAALPALLKRVALAAWPRRDVASLSGPTWVAFVREHAGRAGFPDEAARLLADGEYRPASLATLSVADAGRIVDQVRHWIEEHHVRP